MLAIQAATDLHMVGFHDCAESEGLARKYLIPPHSGGTFELWDGPYGTVHFQEVPVWSFIVLGGSSIEGDTVPIPNCPWCQCHLPLEGEELDGIDFGKVGSNV